MYLKRREQNMNAWRPLIMHLLNGDENIQTIQITTYNIVINTLY